MTDRPPSDLTDKMLLRVPDGFRARIAALAKLNGRSSNAEAVKALESWLDLAEHGQQAAEEVKDDLPEPAQRLGTIYVALDADGPVSIGEVMANVDGITDRGGFDVVDLRVSVVTTQQVSSNSRKAEILATTERYRALAKDRDPP